MKVDDAGHKPSNPQSGGSEDTQAGQARTRQDRAGQGVGQDALVHA